MAVDGNEQLVPYDSGKRPRSVSYDVYYDEDMIVEILSRIPVKSLLRLRCVCKSWRALISESHFFRKQLSHAFCLSLLGSIEYKEAALLKLDYNSNMIPNFFGFGFDSTTEDYKVLVGCKPIPESWSFDANDMITHIAFFTMKSGSCRTLDSVNVIRQACLLNGALHWLSLERDGLDDPITSTSTIMLASLLQYAELKFHESNPRREYNIKDYDCERIINNLHLLEVKLVCANVLAHLASSLEGAFKKKVDYALEDVMFANYHFSKAVESSAHKIFVAENNIKLLKVISVFVKILHGGTNIAWNYTLARICTLIRENKEMFSNVVWKGIEPLLIIGDIYL